MKLWRYAYRVSVTRIEVNVSSQFSEYQPLKDIFNDVRAKVDGQVVNPMRPSYPVLGRIGAAGQRFALEWHQDNITIRERMWPALLIGIMYLSSNTKSLPEFVLKTIVMFMILQLVMLKMRDPKLQRGSFELPFVSQIGDQLAGVGKHLLTKSERELIQRQRVHNQNGAGVFFTAIELAQQYQLSSSIIKAVIQGLRGLQGPIKAFDCVSVVGLLMVELLVKKVDCQVEMFSVPGARGQLHAYLVFNRQRGNERQPLTWNGDAIICCAWYSGGVFKTIAEIQQDPDFFDHYPLLRTDDKVVDIKFNPADTRLQSMWQQFQQHYLLDKFPDELQALSSDQRFSP